jgi:hypothetical protein
LSEELPASEDLESYSKSVDSMELIITLIAILHIITGLLVIPIVNTIFTSNIFQAPLIVTVLVILQGSILAVTMPLYIILGWAILRIQSWAWKFSVIVNSVCLVLNIFGGFVIIACMNIILIFLLFGSDVQLALSPFEEE